ncbi:MAG: hypothetical protein WBM44_16120 [Waterburya sp.]
MSNQEIYISAHTNEEGIVKIDVPTGIANRDIQLVVSFKAVEKSAHTSGEMRIPGIDEGRFVVPDDFDDPLPAELLKAFEGGD